VDPVALNPLALFDKYYKIGAEKFIEELATLGLSASEQKKIIAFTKTKLDDVSEDLSSNDLFKR